MSIRMAADIEWLKARIGELAGVVAELEQRVNELAQRKGPGRPRNGEKAH